MKRLFISLVAVVVCLLCAASKPKTMSGTLVRTRTADPCLVYHEGMFYLTMTGTSRLAIVKDSDLRHLTAEYHPLKENIVYDSRLDPTVAELYGEGAEINGTWSPEIHYFSEKEFPGKGGWYLYFALRKKVVEQGRVNSREVRMVVMKSLSGKVEGPYGHPVTGRENQSQPLVDESGEVISDWCGGPSLLRIASGRHRGFYITWIEEQGRGEGPGRFFQKIMISRVASPWQFVGEKGVVTTPTQRWEFRGSGKTHPRVVEGGTAVYGDRGEVFLTYSGSGYWSDYGLGQLTLRRDGGDYANPLRTESWIKYDGNPIFTSVGSEELRGAGHATFVEDGKGGRFFCYHAYPVVEGKKQRSRNAYIEPYRIDRSAVSPSAPDGVLRMGAMGDGRCAPTDTKIRFRH